MPVFRRFVPYFQSLPLVGQNLDLQIDSIDSDERKVSLSVVESSEEAISEEDAADNENNQLNEAREYIEKSKKMSSSSKTVFFCIKKLRNSY